MSEELTNKNLAFYFDMNACLGCKACMIACRDKHDSPADVQWRKVIEATGGEWVENTDGTYNQNVFAYYISMSCNHCENPLCVQACPTGACQVAEGSNIVFIDESRCVGCGYCKWNCPYDAPQLNKEKKHMTKCDMCQDYLAVGKKPSCVEACPARALDIGTREELIEKYGHAHFAPLPSPNMTKPAFAINPNRNAKPSGSTDVTFANREEC